jgi:hypothetical protein
VWDYKRYPAVDVDARHVLRDDFCVGRNRDNGTSYSEGSHVTVIVRFPNRQRVIAWIAGSVQQKVGAIQEGLFEKMYHQIGNFTFQSDDPKSSQK